MATVARNNAARGGAVKARSPPSSLVPACRACRAQRAAPLAHRQWDSRPRAKALVVRADVNWDAFRPSSINLQQHRYQAQNTGAGAVQQYDFLVIGSGIAGLTYALKVAEHGRVAIITKDFINEGCTQYAQGGVCAVLDASDSVENHVRDTIVAGAFLNDHK